MKGAGSQILGTGAKFKRVPCQKSCRVNRVIETQQLKTEYLENQSRRNNIRVNGIEESDEETWQDSEEKVKMAVREKLGTDITIERGRTASKKEAVKMKTIVCRLRDWKQREQVLCKARREKPEGLFILEDLAFETLQKR